MGFHTTRLPQKNHCLPCGHPFLSRGYAPCLEGVILLSDSNIAHEMQNDHASVHHLVVWNHVAAPLAFLEVELKVLWDARNLCQRWRFTFTVCTTHFSEAHTGRNCSFQHDASMNLTDSCFVTAKCDAAAIFLRSAERLVLVPLHET